MMSRSADDQRVLAAMEEYETAHRHPSRPRFAVHEPHTMSSEGVKGAWEGSKPSYSPGCYVLFSEAGDLLYVGKASHGKTVGDRIVRFRYKAITWDVKPAYVRIIEVTDAFGAPSLEEFLIVRLQPRYNKHGLHALV